MCAYYECIINVRNWASVATPRRITRRPKVSPKRTKWKSLRHRLKECVFCVCAFVYMSKSFADIYLMQMHFSAE